MKTALITGANRGIGLELTRQLRTQGYCVIAVCRKSSEDLKKEDVRILEGIDVSTDAGISKLANELKGEKLSLLINNAGIFSREHLENFDLDGIRRQFEVNTLGPLRVTQQLISHLEKGSKVVMITSRMGSIADNESGTFYGYRISKAGLNAGAKTLSIDLKPKGVWVAIIHPGYVKTDMTDHQGNISTKESAQGILSVVEGLNADNSGSFWHSNGEELPW